MGASRRQVRQLEDRCREAGLKITDLRRVRLHGVLEAGDGATAIVTWKTLTRTWCKKAMCQHGSLQRNLKLLVKHGVLHRDVGADRLWRYRIASCVRDTVVGELNCPGFTGE